MTLHSIREAVKRTPGPGRVAQASPPAHGQVPLAMGADGVSIGGKAGRREGEKAGSKGTACRAHLGPISTGPCKVATCGRPPCSPVGILVAVGRPPDNQHGGGGAQGNQPCPLIA